MGSALGYFRLTDWGEAPHALLVFKEGARADERELREFARANLAHFKAPHSVTFVNELPTIAALVNSDCSEVPTIHRSTSRDNANVKCLDATPLPLLQS